MIDYNGTLIITEALKWGYYGYIAMSIDSIVQQKRTWKFLTEIYWRVYTEIQVRFARQVWADAACR